MGVIPRAKQADNEQRPRSERLASFLLDLLNLGWHNTQMNHQ